MFEKNWSHIWYIVSTQQPGGHLFSEEFTHHTGGNVSAEDQLSLLQVDGDEAHVSGGDIFYFSIFPAHY